MARDDGRGTARLRTRHKVVEENSQNKAERVSGQGRLKTTGCGEDENSRQKFTFHGNRSD